MKPFDLAWSVLQCPRAGCHQQTGRMLSTNLFYKISFAYGHSPPAITSEVFLSETEALQSSVTKAK